ncbi:hypothetical protein D3OALGA1CA_2195 [Olavius algarvensis associated proteobacterium Delta 3]|nr:hypothetical protein D3OALGA1CA_2195 [Olavius algarvensis associated proteobacterium Delta 3]
MIHYRLNRKGPHFFCDKEGETPTAFWIGVTSTGEPFWKLLT